MANKSIHRQLAIAWSIATTMLLSFSVNLASAQSSSFTINHTPPSVEDLPSPGAELILSPTVKGTKDLKLRMQAYVVIDGRVLEQPLKMRLDDATNIVFDLTTRAPVGEISYQFFLIDGQNTIAQSQRYSIRRSCIPSITSGLTQINSDLSPEDKVKATVKNVGSLKQDIENYKRALVALNKIQDRINEK